MALQTGTAWVGGAREPGAAVLGGAEGIAPERSLIGFRTMWPAELDEPARPHHLA